MAVRAMSSCHSFSSLTATGPAHFRVRSVNHFELIFVYGVRKGFIGILLHMNS